LEQYVFCDQCGSENPTENKFCGQCGARLETQFSERTGPLPVATGPVSSEFRREVEQQQLRLQRLREEPVTSYSELATSSSIEHPQTDDRVEYQNDGNSVEDPPRNGRYGSTTHDEYDGEPDRLEPPISGPSFLGLSGSVPADGQDLSYLYEDDSRPGAARRIVALLIALGFIAFIIYEWRQNPNWQSAIVERANAIRAKAASSAAPNRNAAPQAQSAEATSTAAVKGNQDNNSSGAAPPANAPVQTNEDEAVSAEGQVPPESSARDTAASPTAGGRPASASKAHGQNEPADANPSGGNGEPAKSDDGALGSIASGAARAQTNSTGAVGEQAAVDSDKEPVTEDTADNESPVRSSGHRGDRKATATPVKPEQPDSDLVAKADALLYGRGVRQDCKQALVYLRTAANRGSATARSKLGGLYATGHCVPLDRAEAYNWFTLARDAGASNVWVDRNRLMLWSKMTADEKARTMEPPR
jgi:TPR repeat protein